MKTRILITAIILFAGSECSVTASQILNVTIYNLKASVKGTLCIAVFTDEDGFKTEKESFIIKCDKAGIKNGEVKVEIPVKAGIYGLSVLDDENNSGKMEYNILGIPKEGFGFSDFYLKKMRKPKFNDFSFKVSNSEVKDILVRMKYL
ncbi:MAG: DUF2141 domain-containing protein [Paludibacteraceae bacterium]